MLILKFLKDLFSKTYKCDFCQCPEDINETIDYNNKTGYICASCLRHIRFRESNYFKSIKGRGKY